MRICRLCRKKFPLKGLRGGQPKACDSCRNAKPFCACACGKRVLSIAEHQRPTIAKYLDDHEQRAHATEKGKAMARGRIRYWKNLTEEAREEVSKRQSRKTSRMWRGGVYANQARKLKDRWESLSAKERERHVRAARAGARVKPNRPEKKLEKILGRLFPGEFRMNVLGRVVIDGRVPDFVNVNGKKVLVELFGDYWHGEERRGHSEKEEERERKLHFKKWGFKTVIVWESELKNERLVRQRILAALK